MEYLIFAVMKYLGKKYTSPYTTSHSTQPHIRHNLTSDTTSHPTQPHSRHLTSHAYLHFVYHHISYNHSCHNHPPHLCFYPFSPLPLSLPPPLLSDCTVLYSPFWFLPEQPESCVRVCVRIVCEREKGELVHDICTNFAL